MTNQQQAQDTITPDEIGAEWGMKLGAALLEKINLQKQIDRLTTITNEYAKRIGELEAKMEGLSRSNQQRQIALEDEVFNLKAEITELEDSKQELEAELGDYRAFAETRTALSQEAAKAAAGGDAILAGAKNEKAAPD